MRKTVILLAITGCIATGARSQLKIDNGTFFISAGATVTVQGDLTSNVDIQGTGVVLLKGTGIQNVDMGGFTIPNLEMDNAANATLLNSNARIGNSLVFTNGKIQTGNLNLILAPAATVTGANASRFVWTNGTGQLIKQLSADVASYELPVGENANYRPAYLTTAGSAYAAAQFGVRVLGAADPNKPPSTATHLNTAWPVTRSGITGGTVTLAGQYLDPTDVFGTEANLVGYYLNNGSGDWTSAGETHNTVTNRVSVPVTTAAGTVSGINKFILAGSRAFLQGPYEAATGLMQANLRLLPFGSSASAANFPSTDPYRTATYSASFVHVNNTNVETIPNSGVLGVTIPADNTIVDWVFLQLRDLNASPGNTVLQTRSALVQRDGDIVDVDGVSPVTFNNIADGNYIMTVRHRNHLGLSMDQVSPRLVTETRSSAWNAPNVFDTRTAPDGQLFGTNAAYTTATHPVLTNVNLLWGGNVSGNGFTRYQGTNGPGATNLNDRQVLLNDLGNAELNTLTGYYRGDINMNRFMRYQGNNGPGIFNQNDRQYLLGVILANTELSVRTQTIPN